MSDLTLFDDRRCLLGEGPLWHPLRQELFWCDILGQKLLSRAGDETREWRFDDLPSAVGWVDEDRLLVATDKALLLLTLSTGAREILTPFEPDLPSNRSNDGRADPHGGFWIGSMGKAERNPTGSFWRYYRGEMRRLVSGIITSNACCFSPDGLWAYLADSHAYMVQRVPLSEKDGWPVAEPEPWLDLRSEDKKPDGAVVAADGTFWNAQWGAGRIAQYSPAGAFLQALTVPAAHSSCPAFGGADLTTLYCTTAAIGDAAPLPDTGCTFSVEGVGPGQREHQVIL